MADSIQRRYKNFPPGWDHIRVPVSSRRAALAGLSLYAACRPRALWGQRVAWVCVAIFGPRTLPGRSLTWVPMASLEWVELAETWRRELGAFDEVTGFARLDVHRGGLALLLLRKGSPIAFVKVHHGTGGSILNERRALEAVSKCRPRSFQAPELIQSGFLHGWHYLAAAPLPLGLHRPPRHPPLQAILEEIEGALTQMPRPAGTPEHWRPMHGDFAPWNLRRCAGKSLYLAGKSLYLMDWENAGWGPPNADEVFYRAADAALKNTLPDRSAAAAAANADEAIRFWRGRVAADADNDRDRRLARSLRAALQHMARFPQLGETQSTQAGNPALIVDDLGRSR